MIPKVIHYCWFGGKQLPLLAEKCIESWKKNLSEYKIVCWNEDNFDLDSCKYVKEAYKAEAWAFVSDYARLKVVYDNGGIYLDTDVEVLRPYDDLLNKNCFLCSETSGYVATGLGFGAEKGSMIIGEMLDQYEQSHYDYGNGVYDETPCPLRNTLPLTRLGFSFSSDSIWENKNVIVFPPEYFCPMDYVTREINVTDNTYSIHHYSALWINDSDREKVKKIAEIEEKHSVLISKIMTNRLVFQELKKEGKTNSLFMYLLSKIKRRIAAARRC